MMRIQMTSRSRRSPVAGRRGTASGTKSNPIEGEALKLQRPRPDGALKIVATGEKEDQAVA
jgi:hypothetical protein